MASAPCSTTQGGCGGSSIVTRLSIMMFVQFFVWGAWFTTLGPCLSTNKLGDIIGGAYGTAPVAAIIAPLFLGIIADRFFASQKVMALLFLLGGAALCAVPHFAAKGNADAVFWLFQLHMLCYMPTLGLSNTVAFSNVADATAFPKIRVWGTIGWIAAGLFNGFMGWSASLNMFYVAGLAALALGVFSFTLPNTPPPSKGQPLNLRAIFMVDALSLLAKPAFAVFAVCSTLICIPLAYYYGVCAGYLTASGFAQPASTMTIGQMSEIFFMLLIPFFFRKLGVKWMILIGMLAWVARYVLFAFGAPSGATWMLFGAIALHGICYDFFFVTGFIYTEKTAPANIRGQAQALLVFLTQGIGMFLGFKVAFNGAGAAVGKVTHAGEVTHALSFAQANPKETADLTTAQIDATAKFVAETGKALKAADPAAAEAAAKNLDATIAGFAGSQQLAAEKAAWLKQLLTAEPAAGASTSVIEGFKQMFSVSQPEGLNASILADTMAQWKTFWMVPAIMAGVIAVIFFLGFWDKSKAAASAGEAVEAGGKEELP